MKPIKFKYLISVLLIISLSLSLCSCSSGISRSDYDKLLKSKYDSDSKLSSLQKNYNKLKNDYLDCLDKQTKSITDTLPINYAKAWASTSLDKNAKCAVVDDNLFVIVKSESKITSDMVSAFITKYISAIKVYQATYSLTPDSLPFKTVSVFYEDLDDNYIINIPFTNTNGNFKDKGVLVNSSYNDMVSKSFDSFSNK